MWQPFWYEWLPAYKFRIQNTEYLPGFRVVKEQKGMSWLIPGKMHKLAIIPNNASIPGMTH